MFSFSSSKPVRHFLGCILFSLAFASSSQAACLLPDGPPNTLVPDGYHFSVDGKWKHCQKGAWAIKGSVTKERPFTPNETGVCLPLENQFTKKNGVISMNFVPEKTMRNFYGFEHECVASTWWRVPGGATASDISKIAKPEPTPAKAVKKDPLKGLEDFYNSDPVPTPVTKSAPSAPPETSKQEDPPFPFATKIDPVKPAETLRSKTPSSPSVQAEKDAPRQTPDFSFQKPASTSEITADYKACQVNCRMGMDERVKNAESECKQELRKRYGQGEWPESAEKDFRRCRILAARQENNRLRSCILPCKKQAGHHVWQGP